MADYTARSSVILNGQQAEDQLEKLGKRAKSLRDEMKKLRQANDLAGFKEKDKELKQVNKEMRQMRKEAFSVENVLKNLSGASFKEIQTAARKANAEFKAMKQTDPGFAKKAAQVKLLNGKVRELGALTRSQQGLWSRAAAGFNKYFSIITAGAASFAGVFIGMRKAIDASNDFEERLSNLSALTGLAGNELNWLSQQAKDLSQSTLDGGIRITKSAKDIVDAYTKMGSARPELLKNKEALVDVTKQALTLAEAAKLEMQPAIDAVAASMNQFSLPASESVRIINALAAGSLAGSAEVFDITESLANVGTVAADSNLSLEQTVGVLETLAERQLKGAEAGTQLRSSLLSMKAAGLGYQSGIFNMRDAVVELKSRIDAQSTAVEKDAVLIDVFGKRNITVGTILANSVDRLDSFTNAVTNTNTATEQAITNTDNQNAKLAQAKNRINVVAIELGQKLAPAYASVISKSSAMLKFLVTIVDLFYKYGKTLIIGTSAVVSYTVAVKLMTLWEARKNKEVGIGLVLSKAKVFWHTAEKAALLLAAGAQALLTGNITRATAAMRLFNATTKLSPVGILISLLTIAATAYFTFRNKTDNAKKSQKEFNDEVERGNELLGQTKTLEERVAIIKNLSKQQLENLKSDLQNQINSEQNFHTTLLQKLKKRLDEDEQLKTLYAKRNMDGLTRIQKLNIAAQINARKRALSTELENENKTNQQRLNNLKKYLNNVNTEIKKRPEEATGGNNDDLMKALELANKQRIFALQQQYGTEENMQKLLHARLLANQLAYLQAKANLETDESKKLDLQTKIIEVQNKYNQSIREAVDSLKIKETSVEAVNTKLLEEGKLTNINAQRAAKAASEQDELNKKLTSQAQTYQQTVKAVSDGLFNLMSGGEDAFKTFAKNMLIFALEQLKTYTELQIAGVTIGSLASPESIATFGVAGLAKAALLVGLIEAAFAGVEGLVNGSFTSKQTKAYATGKYPDMEFAGSPKTGTYGNKPHLGIFNEVPGQPEIVIDGPTTRQIEINYPEIKRAIYDVRDGRIPRFANGKYPDNNFSTNTQPLPQGIDQQTAIRLATAIEKFNDKELVVYTELIKNDLDTLNDIVTKRGFKQS